MQWLSYWVSLIGSIVFGIPIMWTYKYLAHVRRRRAWFLALSPEAVAEINRRKQLSLNK